MSRRGLVVALLLVACVPETDEQYPLGGFAVRVIPSAETSGKPFTSADGWTVTIERFALRARAQAGVPGDQVTYGGGNGTPRTIAPGEACELRVTQMVPGPRLASVALQSAFVRRGSADDDAWCGIDEDMRARFEARGVSGRGPTVVVVARAEKAGQRFRLELALDAVESRDARRVTVPVTVVANDGVRVRIGVHAEQLFIGRSPLAFDALAEADAKANADGTVTRDELDFFVRSTLEEVNAAGLFVPLE